MVGVHSDRTGSHSTGNTDSKELAFGPCLCTRLHGRLWSAAYGSSLVAIVICIAWDPAWRASPLLLAQYMGRAVRLGTSPGVAGPLFAMAELIMIAVL